MTVQNPQNPNRQDIQTKIIVRAFACFLLTVLITFGVFSNHAWALGGFSQTCKDSRIGDSDLFSTCTKANGGTKPTSIDLDKYIENVNGSLEWQQGNFSHTCRKIKLASSTMSAECKTRAQVWVNTSINLDEHIANIDGSLTYE